MENKGFLQITHNRYSDRPCERQKQFEHCLCLSQGLFVVSVSAWLMHLFCCHKITFVWYKHYQGITTRPKQWRALQLKSLQVRLAHILPLYMTVLWSLRHSNRLQYRHYYYFSFNGEYLLITPVEERLLDEDVNCRFWTSHNQTWHCRTSKCTINGITLRFLLASNVVALHCAGSGYSIRNFHWAFKHYSLLKFAIGPVFNTHVVGCSTFLEMMILIRT